MREFYVHTCEHRRYKVKAKSKEDAILYLDEADLRPKDKKVKLETIGDFQIMED